MLNSIWLLADQPLRKPWGTLVRNIVFENLNCSASCTSQGVQENTQQGKRRHLRTPQVAASPPDVRRGLAPP
jgi:hypothetical protein